MCYGVENTNFTLAQDASLYNYDRLRLSGDYTLENYFFSLKGDLVSYYGEYLVSPQKSDTSFPTQSRYYKNKKSTLYGKFYRAYGGYEDDANRLIVGLQNISMGVGRVWNPTNLFNPRNIYTLEPDEIFGFFGLAYTRHISDMAEATVVVSQKSDTSYKYAGEYKSFLGFADVGVLFVSSVKTQMLGYEIEGNLAESGIEVRSEGAYMKTKLQTTRATQESQEFFQGIVGADYAFSNGVNILFEALYSSKTFSQKSRSINLNSQEIAQNIVDAHIYTALNLQYDINMFFATSLLYIESFSGEKSRFISPTLNYTLNDYNSFVLGALLQNRGQENYYLKWSLSF